MRRIDWQVVTLWALAAVWCILIGWLIAHTVLNIVAYLHP